MVNASNATHSDSHPGSDNVTEYCRQVDQKPTCKEGILIPLWMQAPSESFSAEQHAVVYGLALFYCLLGITIITDRIVDATEVAVWHPVVAALTFEIIGTCSPEILLPIIEMFYRGFRGDEMGPALILGSGAYHLFVITAICLFSVRESTGKSIKDLPLFLTTVFFMLFAFLWMYLVTGVISPDAVEISEALVTLFMFPVMVVSCWLVASRQTYAKLLRELGSLKRVNTLVTLASNASHISVNMLSMSTMRIPHEERRLAIAHRMSQLQREHPDCTAKQVKEMVMEELFDAKLASGTAYFTRVRTFEERKLRSRSVLDSTHTIEGVTPLQTVGFVNESISCLESCGVCTVSLDRFGDKIDQTSLTVEVTCQNGTAKAGVHFEDLNDLKVVFAPGQEQADFHVSIIDDDVFEHNSKDFYLCLRSPSITGQIELTPNGSQARVVKSVLRMTIMDDDHCGVFILENSELALPDDIGVAKIKVRRTVGTKGYVILPYRITPGTAKPDDDYCSDEIGFLSFPHGKSESSVEIQIIDKHRFGTFSTFYIELLPPRRSSSITIKNTLGSARLGNPHLTRVAICENVEVKETLDRLVRFSEFPGVLVSTTWKGQFYDAVNFNNVQAENRLSLFLSLSYFIITSPWNLVVAFVPPTRFLQGWVAYFCLLLLMIVIDCIVIDLITVFACSVGIKGSIAAVTLIPMGMGVTDSFASHRSAVHDKTADAALGLIVSASAVIVFLGLGLSWSIGAIYQASVGSSLRLESAVELGFTVLLYCVFATTALLVLLIRRFSPICGELGGPTAAKHLSGTFFLLLWISYIVIFALRSYCLIHGFA